MNLGKGSIEKRCEKLAVQVELSCLFPVSEDFAGCFGCVFGIITHCFGYLIMLLSWSWTDCLLELIMAYTIWNVLCCVSVCFVNRNCPTHALS